MYVSVTFLGLQRAKAQTDQIQVPLSKETRVADLLAYIKERYPNLPFPDDGILVAVNNKLSSMERVLKNKDNVAFLPFLGGG
jgi:molybdopterin converting factor small subunit